MILSSNGPLAQSDSERLTTDQKATGSSPVGPKVSFSSAIAIIGGGPAGLFAAETLRRLGHAVALYEQHPVVGIKFLIAARGGLNLTHSEDLNTFLERYRESYARLSPMIRAFSPDDLRKWALDLGFPTFIGTSRRVFPKNRHPSALLRAWLRLLTDELAIPIHTGHRLKAIQRHPRLELIFDTPQGLLTIFPQAALLACGGASWPKSGSDGRWSELLRLHGVQIVSFQPANCGWKVAWVSDFIDAHQGHPLKNIIASAGGFSRAGDLVITQQGIEGTPIYALTPELRKMDNPALTLNLKPDLSANTLCKRLERHPSKMADLLRMAAKRWNLSSVAFDLLRFQNRPKSFEDLVRLIHAFPLPLIESYGIDRAISSAGGVAWDELNDALMLKKIPGLFAAGEMIDWEAPTGGYLLQGTFATAYHAAMGIDRFMRLQANSKEP